MSIDLSSVIAATTQWLVSAYPAVGGPLTGALAEAQARQAATVAAWLRYPTSLDAELLTLTGPGGSAHLDWLVGADSEQPEPDRSGWRTWVDEVVASWAATLLTDPALAASATAALEGSDHASGSPVDFRRLTDPDARDRDAAALLRHPDCTGPLAALHRGALLERLGTQRLAVDEADG
ncbi:hypothetical protein [Streptomyces sp. NPDC051776]|uniref:hypothetical protein n=1 Tax=Streptomyces sp. NPDC051776 TaxID=3155414 RepID=UPI0034457E62